MNDSNILAVCRKTGSASAEDVLRWIPAKDANGKSLLNMAKMLQILLERVVFLYYKCGFGVPFGMNNEDKTCSQCGQKDRCSQLYAKLGQSKGPAVAWKVTLAFLVPIVVFIGSLAGANRLLQGTFEGNTLTGISFLASAAVTLAAVLLIRVIGRTESHKK